MKTKTAHQRRIEDFMRLANQEIPEQPTVPSEEVRRLRARLILEEALETVEALGFDVKVESSLSNPTVPVIERELIFVANRYREIDLTEIADGCADISVVTIGTLSACGISDQPLLEEVDRSNLAKFGPGGYAREDGKWMKPPDWKAPNIVSVLIDQCD